MKINFNKHALFIVAAVALINFNILPAQGVTTGGLNGIVTSDKGNDMVGANVVVKHEPSGISYGTTARDGGVYTIINMKVGGPYTVTVSFIGYTEQAVSNVFIDLAANTTLDFNLAETALEMAGVDVLGETDDVLNGDRTGAATFIGSDLLATMPSIKRSTRDLTRLDPRSDGNFSFAGRNWLYNNISLDGSYFNNPFGLDDPAPGGQANAEPVPFDAIEQVQVSVAPFDVREGGFTGAGINIVTKSGTNKFGGSAYSFIRNESLQGKEVSGEEVIANPSLSFNQTGFTVHGPIKENELFFFANFEMESRTDPGSNFVANTGGDVGFGESRVDPDVMDAISDRMLEVYGYDTGPYQNYDNETENTKLLVKLDWNISDQHKATLRYNFLDASRDLGPHGFVLSYNNSGRGPNATSLPFQNSGYTINNVMHSFAGEVNSMFGGNMANRFFFSYNRHRDWRTPKSVDFPTVEIGEAGATYTTVGHEPFSIHNILDQDVLQITNNFSLFKGSHIFTAGVNYEQFKFFNSFNIFRHGVFFLPNFLFDIGFILGGTTFPDLETFFAETDPDGDTDPIDFPAAIATGPYKGEIIEVAQFSVYGQDEWAVNKDLNLTYGLRVDIPIYNTTPVDNPYSTGLTLLDENGDDETVDQAKLPDAAPLFSPRIGFNWDMHGDRSMQIRGGTGIFTGRLPFVWIGNVISNPGANPNITGDGSNGQETDDGKNRKEDEGKASVLQQSFDLNAMPDDFKWAQILTTNLAVDMRLPMDMVGTFEMVYGKDINAIYMRNADLKAPSRYLEDGRPYYTSDGTAQLNLDAFGAGDGGVYVIDNTDEGYNLTLTRQLRKSLNGVDLGLAYTFTDAKNNLKSTEIASVLWQSQPVQGDPNNPKLAPSEFGSRHRIIGTANYRKTWNESHSTSFGVFFEMAEGNRYVYSGGNRYSFTYAGDVNGDEIGGNDLIYIPKDANDIVLETPSQWSALDAFIEQDDYLSENRGKISERHGLTNPWFSNIDLRVMHDFNTNFGKFQLTLDLLNAANLLSSDMGVRQVADPQALVPLELVEFDDDGEPVLKFNGVENTFIDDPGVYSRWRMQIGLNYIF
ncbi:MAG: TonB-dependent receptor [Candidatus Neomarinimicrobiota bacterium]